MKQKNGEHPFGDAGQLFLLVLFLVVWVGDSFFLHKSIFLSDHVPLLIRLLVLGLSLATTFYLFVSGHGVVSSDHRPSGVVSTGAFKSVRHPLYLGCILFYIGLAVFTISLLSLAVLGVIIVFYNYIASYEEELLDQQYGESYRVYKKRTGKWVPKKFTKIGRRV